MAMISSRERQEKLNAAVRARLEAEGWDLSGHTPRVVPPPSKKKKLKGGDLAAQPPPTEGQLTLI